MNWYPLPLISFAFELLQESTIFTISHLVHIRDGDTFNTPTGHYEYLVMPFGLTNAPAVIQALINDILQDMHNRFLFVYLDGILIFSRTQEVYIHHVELVLQHLQENSSQGREV